MISDRRQSGSSESPYGTNAYEDGESDYDSDEHAHDRRLSTFGNGYRANSTALTGKTHHNMHKSDLQRDLRDLPMVPNDRRRGDQSKDRSLPVRSGKGATPLEMVISSKMAADTQSEMMSSLERVRSLRSRVMNAQKDIVDAQKDAFDARKDAMEAKTQAIKAKEEAADAMKEAREAMSEASQRRNDITSNPSNILATQDPRTQLANILTSNVGQNSNIGESLISQTSSAVEDKLQAVSEHSNQLSNSIDNNMNDIKHKMDAAQSVVSDSISSGASLSLTSLWTPFLLRLALLLAIIGAGGLLIGAIVTAFDDSEEIKAGVYVFLLVFAMLPAFIIVIFLLAKSNVMYLCKTTKELREGLKAVEESANNATVTFSDHVVDIAQLENHHGTSVDDGMEEIPLGDTGGDATDQTTTHADQGGGGGISNPAFAERPV